jgi:hypothetical protein
MPHGPKWWETSKNPAIWRDGVRPGGLVTPAAAPGEKISGGGGNASGSARGSFQFLREAQRHPLAVGSSKRGGDTARGAPPNRRHPCMTHRREPPTSASAFQLRTPTTSTTTSQWSARPGHATLRRRSALLACSARAHHTTWSVVLLLLVTWPTAPVQSSWDECSTRHGVAIKGRVTQMPYARGIPAQCQL